MISRTSWARLAQNNSNSASDIIPADCLLYWRTCRICSPTFVPPGSRSTKADRPLVCKLSTTYLICVLLPQPSPPSNVINLPARAIAGIIATTRSRVKNCDRLLPVVIPHVRQISRFAGLKFHCPPDAPNTVEVVPPPRPVEPTPPVWSRSA